MSIYISSIDNDNSESKAVVIIGYGEAHFKNGDFSNASISYGGLSFPCPSKYEIYNVDTPNQPVLYVATTSSIGYFQIHGSEVRYYYNKFGQQNALNGVWTQIVEDGGTYELEIKNGGVVGLTLN